MSTSESIAWFDRAYRRPLTLWGDPRIPGEVAALARDGAPRTALELGCGLGRLSRYLAQQGLQVTGVDFSPVAIARAHKRIAGDQRRPELLVGDVTRLDALRGPFDVTLDVGCFHCLHPEGQRAYASELSRLLRPGGTHLLWAMDSAPGGLELAPAAIEAAFGPRFHLRHASPSRRRLVRSHWYWLVAREG